MATGSGAEAPLLSSAERHLIGRPSGPGRWPASSSDSVTFGSVLSSTSRPPRALFRQARRAQRSHEFSRPGGATRKRRALLSGSVRHRTYGRSRERERLVRAHGPSCHQCQSMGRRQNTVGLAFRQHRQFSCPGLRYEARRIGCAAIGFSSCTVRSRSLSQLRGAS